VLVPNHLRAFVVLDGEGEKLQGPAGGPPEHIHIREDEIYYILDGQLRFKVDQEFLDARTGSLVFIPQGTPHCFQNTGQDPAPAAGNVHPGRHGTLLRGHRQAALRPL
jgi:mannose-6-phosphate isomerase-like protein (cupin superfamily)